MLKDEIRATEKDECMRKPLLYFWPLQKQREFRVTPVGAYEWNKISFSV
jgi:hypothetical protein